MKSSTTLVCLAFLLGATLAHEVTFEEHPLVDTTKWYSWIFDQIRFSMWMIWLTVFTTPFGWIITFFFGKPQFY